MEKKPKIFKPNMSFIDNNEKAYVSFLNDYRDNNAIFEESKKSSTNDVHGFLNKLSNSGSYVFNKKLEIVTHDKTYHTRIAGKIGNRIITLDNDSINIDDIITISEE